MYTHLKLYTFTFLWSTNDMWQVQYSSAGEKYIKMKKKDAYLPYLAFYKTLP